MNNKSKVIHEIKILLIVGNELLKNFQRLRFTQLHNVLNCTFLTLSWSSVLMCALHCFFPSTNQFFCCVSFSSWLFEHKHNWFHLFFLLFSGRFAIFINVLSHIKESRFSTKVINLSGRLFCIVSRKKPFWGLRIILFAVITSEIKFCWFVELFFILTVNCLIAQNGLNVDLKRVHYWIQNASFSLDHKWEMLIPRRFVLKLTSTMCSVDDRKRTKKPISNSKLHQTNPFSKFLWHSGMIAFNLSNLKETKKIILTTFYELNES